MLVLAGTGSPRSLIWRADCLHLGSRPEAQRPEALLFPSEKRQVFQEEKRSPNLHLSLELVSILEALMCLRAPVTQQVPSSFQEREAQVSGRRVPLTQAILEVKITIVYFPHPLEKQNLFLGSTLFIRI